VDAIRVGPFPCGVAVDPTTHRVYVALPAAHAIGIVDGARASLMAQVPAGEVLNSIAVDKSSHRVYAIDEHNRAVAVLDGISGQVVTTWQLGGAPSAIAADPSTSRVFVADRDKGKVAAFQDSVPWRPLGWLGI
jgi:DNA-binding beta-propeller fold protein YncE